jgi:hypothetical protein
MGEVSLWGTFSVADHLRRRPFVADVLLYDRLVVPVPDSDEEIRRWRDRKRNPELQQNLLEIVGDLGVPIPWSIERHHQWVERYAQGEAAGADEAAIRDDVTGAVGFDANNINAARRSSPRATAADPGTPNPDDPAFMVTRMVLANEFGSRKDRALVARIPRVDEVEAVVAYGSYRDFSSQRGSLTDDAETDGQPVFTFGWSFFVPSSSKRSDQDLLREAVELAHTDEILTWRAAVQRWRRNVILRNKSDNAALGEMEAMIADYRRAARRQKIEVRIRWGLAVAAAAGRRRHCGSTTGRNRCGRFRAGIAHPFPQHPKTLEAAAMFHEARRSFR